jgi:radical SAM superfamily enzyme with C-terminal helix-hairpin-helix motif
MNNLGNTPEDVLEAVRLVNKVGSRRGWNGLPEILPGVNFVLGLPGETKSTFERNREFLEQILEEGLLVRRVNVREVLPLPGTPIWSVGDEIARKHRRSILRFKKWVREVFDRRMMQRVFPTGTILRRCYVEKTRGRVALARQLGSYPVLNYVYSEVRPGEVIDVVVLSHKARSLITTRYPVKARSVPRRYAGKLAQLEKGSTGTGSSGSA